MKKIFCFLLAVFMTVGVVISSGMVSDPVFADCMVKDKDGNETSQKAADNTFLWLRPWYYNLKLDDSCSPVITDSSEDEFTQFVWTIIMNIVFDLFMVIGVLATGYVIYAGYAFLTSGGDPGKASKAKKSLIGAVTGVLVSLSATIIVNTITGAIGSTRYEDPQEVLSGAFGLVFSVAGAVAAGFVVYGGISYITSSGDPGKAKRARMIFIYAIVGLLIVLTAYGIVNMVVGAT